VLFSRPAYGHGFGLRYDLPLPLVLWIIGAASTVLLSFLIVAIAVRSNASVKAPTQLNLLRWQITNAVTGGKTRLIARLLAVAALILIVGRWNHRRPDTHPKSCSHCNLDRMVGWLLLPVGFRR
jgi:hypothetical protein